MRISKITINELFGNRSLRYEIELNEKPPITILHGPNGAGKTVIFKMIAGLFGAPGIDSLIFERYPFALFQIEFEDGEHIRITREYDDRNDKYLEPEVAHSKYVEESYPLPKIKDIEDRLIKDKLRLLPRSLRIKYLQGDISAREIMPFLPDDAFDYEYVSLDSEDLFLSTRREQKRTYAPKWLKNLNSLLDVQIVSTDRLSTRYRPDNISKRTAVLKDSVDLERRINGVIRNANTQENTLNSSFPRRVVNSVNAGNLESWSFDVVQPKLKQLKQERERLVEVGLLDPGEELQVDSYDDNTLGSVLKIYIEQSQQKLGEYKELADKITLYKSMVEELMKDKELRISKGKDEDQGSFKFINKNSNREIPLTELSSGEQHIIVLMYDLIFRGSSGKGKVDKLILIDEPEISLHIAWQKKFVSFLEKITELSPFDIMIATHSPHVVNARWDLEVPLIDMSKRGV